MVDDSSRREFLKQTLLASIAAASVTRLGDRGWDPSTPPQEPAKPFTRGDRATLAAVAETLIPAAPGIPSAVDAGAPDYLERLAEREPLVNQALLAALAEVKAAAGPSGMPFERLDPDARIVVLRGIERTARAQFNALWLLVAEAYYVEPRIQQLLGHELGLTNSVGIRMKPFDERLLERVKAMPRRYREASP